MADTRRLRPKRKFEVAFRNKRIHVWTDSQALKRISLRSMYKESGPVSYMREALALRLMNDIGVPSQKAVHVRLFLNGAFYGLYLLVEEIDNTWLERQRWPADTMLLKAQHWKVRYARGGQSSQNTDPSRSTPTCERPTCGWNARRRRPTSNTTQGQATVVASGARWRTKSSHQRRVCCPCALRVLTELLSAGR